MTYLELLWHILTHAEMGYVHVIYYVFVLLVIVLYYCFPLQQRWVVLLAGSIAFYYLLLGGARKRFFFFLLSVGMAWLWGLILRRDFRRRRKKEKLEGTWSTGEKGKKPQGGKALLFAALLTSAFPLLLKLIPGFVPGTSFPDWLFPIGVSFYSLQIIAYLVDIWRGDIRPEKNPFRFALFVSWFPQIVQGPIPRFEDLEHQLVRGHRFSAWHVTRGVELIIWGFFLKFMIADKAAIVVNTIFADPYTYTGAYAWLGGILYSVQLYCDFLSCVAISQGVSGFFGITLSDNFWHPYFSTTIQEFWRRWHFSFSSWLRDYIYIPLGGSRKGTVRKWINLIITFSISGLWHGSGFKYLFWGAMHAVYQIVGEVVNKEDSALDQAIRGERVQRKYRIIPAFFTFFLVMIGWIIFRADRLVTAFFMIRGMFTVWNPWVVLGKPLFSLGLDAYDWVVLAFSIVILVLVSYMQEKMVIRDWVEKQSTVFRWLVYLGVVFAIVIFGTYGFGFDAQDFIYGGF